MSENCEFDFIYNNLRDILTFLRWGDFLHT